MGDITRLETDAVVNAANSTLLGGGGVDGMIHWAAGSGLLEECRAIGWCPTGEARITGGHDLPAAHVIHTVGPVYAVDGENAPRLLESCYLNSLALAAEHGLRSVAFPSISTGVYGFPIARASRIALREMLNYLAVDQRLTSVIACCFTAHDLHIYTEALAELTRP